MLQSNNYNNKKIIAKKDVNKNDTKIDKDINEARLNNKVNPFFFHISKTMIFMS